MPRGRSRSKRKSSPAVTLDPPMPVGNRSNGEHFHTQTERERRLRASILRWSERLARAHGVDRREFLASSCGMMTSLAVIGACGNGSNRTGGEGSGSGTTSSHGDIDATSTGMTTSGNGYDLGQSDLGRGDIDCTPIRGPELIVDAQTHHVDHEGSWRETNPIWVEVLSRFPQAACGLDAIDCLSAQQYIEHVFVDSDTAVAVLSGIPAISCTPGWKTNCGHPLTNHQIAETRDMINLLARSGRCLTHCMVTPNVDLPLQLEAMAAAKETLHVAGWKCYPPWGPQAIGFSLADPAIGIPFIEKARELDVRVICIHKGIPLPSYDPRFTDPSDVAVVAKMFPDVKFVVYHSAWQHGGGGAEGPYDPDGQIDASHPSRFPAEKGVNSLIHALKAHSLGPGSNVYAELGTVWFNLMNDPDQAAHLLGKLLRFVGEDNVLWGTDSIFNGSPQPQIEAFRAFHIGSTFQEVYGYPELTAELKAKVLGLNAARLFGLDPDATFCRIEDDVASRARPRLDSDFAPRRWAYRPALGPRTRREFLRFRRLHRDIPG